MFFHPCILKQLKGPPVSYEAVPPTPASGSTSWKPTVSRFSHVLPSFPGVKSSLDTWLPIPLFILVLFVFFNSLNYKVWDCLKKLEHTNSQKKGEDKKSGISWNLTSPFICWSTSFQAFSITWCLCTFLLSQVSFFFFFLKLWSKLVTIHLYLMIRYSDHYLSSPLCRKFQEAGRIVFASPTASRVPTHSRPILNIFQKNEWMGGFPKGVT